MLRRINLFGGPGLGKSSTAAFLFSELKSRHYNVELCREYVKEWAYENRPPARGFSQLYIFGKQQRSEEVPLLHGANFIITDSPLWMQMAYIIDRPFYEELCSICKQFDKQYPALNILLKRSVPYKKEGRYETEDEAKHRDESVLLVLKENKLEFDVLCPKNREEILEFVIRKIT